MPDLFLAFDKPAGLTTHTSLNDSDKKKSWVDPHDGFMEWLQARIDQPLFPIHRLDKETTGVILFATSREQAEKARALFETREVEKRYLFVTDRTTSLDQFTAESFIERLGNDYVSRKTDTPNARTRFERLRTEGRFSLWRALPETGKPHQIRLHAEDHGLALLGDSRHGGTEFPALCLHNEFLKIDGRIYQAPPPIYFEDLSLLRDERLVRWLAAVDRRERAVRSAPLSETDTMRWIHTEGDPLRVEQLGDVVNLNWFRETFPGDDEWRSIERLREIKGWSTWYLQIRTDRGKDPHTDRALASAPPPPERWVATENGVRFEFRRETGLSPGLFLDQRKNRAWLQARVSPSSRVLNLFCYTGGFSVAAAKGGAAQVVSIDVSKTFLEWAKTNFTLNDLKLEPHEFRAIDAGEYLAWAAKKNLKFDFIVCDPPSFARTNTRGKKSVFRIENEFEDLLRGCLNIANPNAQILFSTNFEQWSLDEFAARAEGVLKGLKPAARLVSTPSPDLDFELPRAPRHMKSLLIVNSADT